MNYFCECNEDGYCRRYAREMTGRFREICAGVNVDLGTAAAFREQWSREVSAPLHQSTDKPTPLVLKTNQAPGDAVVMTAAIYSLHRAHPGRYLTWVDSPYPDVFAHNPDVQIWVPPNDALLLEMHYPAIHKSNERGIHFMQGWCEFLGFALGINVPLLTNRPHLYFDGAEPKVEDYWVVCSGGKTDLTNKLWGHRRYQEAVVRADVPFIQVGEKTEDHPRLRYTEDMVGKTTLRELFELVRRAQGVLCGVSLLMHVAAALNKPAVVIAGGREPVQWNAYPKQHYLHTVGILPCADPQGSVGGACWRSRTVPLGDGTIMDQHTCQRPIGTIPECMTLIEPEQVARLIRGVL